MKETLICLFLLFCLNELSAQPKKLRGNWKNGKGQEFVFFKNNQVFWIFHEEASKDTFRLQYSANFSVKPHHLDLKGFDRGPLSGKTLYGIFEFIANRTFIFDSEPGTTPSSRPTAFSTSDVETYVRQ